MTADRGDKLAEHKVYFARDDNEGKQIQSLGRLIEFVKPTILMGLSTIGGAFTPELIQKMAELNEHPIIFPLSNPSSKSECTFEEAVKYTDGKVLFASGSPFPEIQHNGEELTPGQGMFIISMPHPFPNSCIGNNMYVFPGIGLGAILSKAVNVTQDMIYASGVSLSESLTPTEKSKGWLYPDIRRIREVSVVVTRGVIRTAQKNGVDRELSLRNLSDDQLDDYIRARMYDPTKETAAYMDEISQLVSLTNGKSAHL